MTTPPPLDRTFQVSVKHVPGLGYEANCEEANFNGKSHWKKAWAIEEAETFFQRSKLELLGKRAEHKDELYLVVTRTPEEQAFADKKEAYRRAKAAKAQGKVTAAAQHRPTEDLELVGPQPNQKQIDAHFQVIRIAIKGNARARNLFFAYAAVAGAHANAIMEIAAHGAGEKLLRERFPDVADNTLKRWRQFATDLAPALAKGPTVGLLTAPALGKKALSAKAAEAIQEAVMEVMDGDGMIEFMRACKALREGEEPKAPGGYRPNKEKLEAWLKENHPELAGTGYDDLPAKVQREFKKFEALDNGRISPEEEKRIAADLAASTAEKINECINGVQKLRMTLEDRQNLVHLGELLAEEMKKLARNKLATKNTESAKEEKA